MEKIKFDEISNMIDDGKILTNIENIIERFYVPITEKEERINRLISAITTSYNEELDKFIEIFEVNNPIGNDVLIKTEIISAYTRLEIDTMNVDETTKVYDMLSKYQLIDKLIESLDDAQKFEHLFYQKLNAHREFKEKEMFSQNINVVSCFDNLIPYAANLLEILANKVEGLDVDKFNKNMNNLDIKKYADEYFKKLTKAK